MAATESRDLDTHVWLTHTANNDLAYVQRFGAMRASAGGEGGPDPLNRSQAVNLAITEYAALLRREVRERPELFLSTRGRG